MSHEVHTAVKGELVPFNLDAYAGEDGVVVHAALIVAVGLSTVLGTGTTRLALAGGAHVDVPKPWVLEHKPKPGDFYVLTGPHSAKIVEGESFEALYQPAPDAPVDETAVEGTAQQSAAPDGATYVKIDDLLALSNRIIEHAPNLEISPDAVVPSACTLIDDLIKERAEIGRQYDEVTAHRDALQAAHDGAYARGHEQGYQAAIDLVASGVVGEPQGSAASDTAGGSAPSAADLDAVAAEQKAAEATADAQPEEGTGDAPATEKEPTD